MTTDRAAQLRAQKGASNDPDRLERMAREAEGHDPVPPHGWTCFHCGEHFPASFVGQRDARAHFGPHPGEEPGCVMQLAPEDRRILARLRRAEEELERYRAEDSDKDREMYAMRADHVQALTREEEKGYARGLKDGLEEAERRRSAVPAFLAPAKETLS